VNEETSNSLSEYDYAKSSDSYAPEDSKMRDENSIGEERKIIKTANLNIGVNDYYEAKEKVEEIIQSFIAYISQENERNSSNSIRNTLTIRVEQEKFDGLLQALEAEADKVESKTTNANDVTEEFIDMESRLENKKKVEEQYRTLLERADTIEDILRVNEHLRRLREEIEATEGRLKYLSDQSAMSTITLYMHQDYDKISYGFLYKVKNAFSGGWEGLLGFIIAFLYIWPIWGTALIILGIIKVTQKKKHHRK
jgi:hypothetical protein